MSHSDRVIMSSLSSGILQFICTYLNPIVFSLLESLVDSCSSCVLNGSEHCMFVILVH